MKPKQNLKKKTKFSLHESVLIIYIVFFYMYSIFYVSIWSTMSFITSLQSLDCLLDEPKGFAQ